MEYYYSSTQPAQVRAWMNNYIPPKPMGVIIYACRNFSGGLTKLPLKFGYGWVIISNLNIGCDYLSIP